MSDGTTPTDKQPRAVIRDETGKWLPGHAPKGGRHKGSSQSDLVRKLIEPHREKLIDRAIALALQTEDPQASARGLDIALSRLAPAPKQESERVEIPGLADAVTFTDKCNVVISAVSTGDISAEAAERILRLLDVYRKAHATDVLEARLRALEQGNAPVMVIEPLSPSTAPDDYADLI